MGAGRFRLISHRGDKTLSELCGKRKCGNFSEFHGAARTGLLRGTMGEGGNCCDRAGGMGEDTSLLLLIGGVAFPAADMSAFIF